MSVAPGGPGAAVTAAASPVGSPPAGGSLSEPLREEIEKLMQRYPHPRSALIPALWLIQGEHGWLPAEAMEELAEMLDLEPVQVQETASFYSLLFKKPVGRYVVDLCTNVACMLLGAYDLSAAVQKKLGIRPGETTPDGLFTLREVECIAACEGSPCAQINYEYYENLTVESLFRKLDDLSAEAKAGGTAADAAGTGGKTGDLKSASEAVGKVESP